MIMPNTFKNPVILDDFTADIDVGISMFGLSEMPFYVDSIEWQTPLAISDHAIVTDGNGVEVFNETPSVAKQSVFKPLSGRIFMGLKVPVGGVGSGKILIHLA